MKVMSTWSAKPGALLEAVSRFLAGHGTPAPGVALLGRWTSADFSCGFTLYETDNPVALFETSAVWADILDLKGHIVVEDAEIGPVLAKMFAK